MNGFREIDGGHFFSETDTRHGNDGQIGEVLNWSHNRRSLQREPGGSRRQEVEKSENNALALVQVPLPDEIAMEQ
jgi:hypothetical protein